jgi:hypothetical protein
MARKPDDRLTLRATTARVALRPATAPHREGP